MALGLLIYPLLCPVMGAWTDQVAWTDRVRRRPLPGDERSRQRHGRAHPHHAPGHAYLRLTEYATAAGRVRQGVDLYRSLGDPRTARPPTSVCRVSSSRPSARPVATSVLLLTPEEPTYD